MRKKKAKGNEERAVNEEMNAKSEQILAYETGTKVYKWKNILRVLLIVLAAVIILELCFYCAAAIATSKKSFPIFVDNGIGGDGKTYGVSLCEKDDFIESTVHLKAETIDEMTCISGFTIPDDVDSGEGSHNGKGYIAYTFYLKNTGEVDCTVEEKMSVIFTAKGADDAIRVRIYRNGEATTYAKPKADGLPEYATEPFADEKNVFINEKKISKDQVLKYTIVVWLEGDDPECIDAIRGGSVRLSMDFSVKE